MSGPDPAVAAVRLAVRRTLAGRLPTGATVLVACSGGADSLALLSATVFEAHQDALRVIGVTVDHGLQPGSAERADAVVAQMVALGAAETIGIRVHVEAPGLGPEAAARQARYAALSEAAQRSGAGAVLLGHTVDDQAETVLMGLARGSGGRSLAGMRRGYREGATTFLRPLLDVTRAQTEAACAASGIEFWSDPDNDDPRFTRSRVRRRVLPVLAEELGPGVVGALARTADSLQEDMELLDELAEQVWSDVRQQQPAAVEGVLAAVDAGQLGSQPVALRRRVLRRAAVAAGCPPSELFRVHVVALDDVAFGEPGRQVQLPGQVTAYRKGDVLTFRRTASGTRGASGPV
jgi:tRNA(Ile)-lysidine synthase